MGAVDNSRGSPLPLLVADAPMGAVDNPRGSPLPQHMAVAWCRPRRWGHHLGRRLQFRHQGLHRHGPRGRQHPPAGAGQPGRALEVRGRVLLTAAVGAAVARAFTHRQCWPGSVVAPPTPPPPTPHPLHPPSPPAQLPSVPHLPCRTLITWSQDEEGSAVAFSKDGSAIYVKSSLDADTTGLQLVSTAPEAEVRAHACSWPALLLHPKPRWGDPAGGPALWLVHTLCPGGLSPPRH